MAARKPAYGVPAGHQPRMMPASKSATGGVPSMADVMDAVADGLENAGGPKDAPDADDSKTND